MIVLALALSLVTKDLGKTQTDAAKTAASLLAIPECAEYSYLTGGMTKNRNYRVGKYVFRFLDLSNPFKFRRGEFKAHEIGHTLSLAPRIHYVDDRASLFVIDYIEGRHIEKEDTEALVQLAHKLQKLHAFTGPYPRRYSQHHRAYLQWERGKQINASYPEGFAHEVKKLIRFRPIKYVPIHGDVIPSNVFVTDRGPVLIDWTNATYDDPLVDLALLPLLLNLSDEEEDTFLSAYGDIDDAAFQAAKKRACLLSALIFFTYRQTEKGNHFYARYLERPL